mmetsp:Transcript_53187/g.99737  ORF Transcript_53187/g.99737 Transcript_53187/m.99737 type:complete len:441 (-) Transcript_53187:150-1472(-)
MTSMKDSDYSDETSPLKGPSLQKEQSSIFSWISWRWFGPGLLVCLADTDAGCLIVAGQSGARWGYSLLLMQVLLIPILFFAQELTVRLGVWTKKGHAACIKEHFGSFWAWATTVLLVLECVAATISEMSGFASIAEMWGLNRATGTILASAVVIGVVVFCKYRQVEAIGVSLGLFELAFVVSMFLLHPSPSDVFKGMFQFHSDGEYLTLVAANIGAVIMPWMIYFQQSAVVARRLTTQSDLAEERTQTLVGSCLTQLVMIGTLVTMAAASKGARESLEHVKDMQIALAPILGSTVSKVIVSFAFLGGSLCATFVVALAASWAVCEAAGWDDAFSLDRLPSEAPRFYACFLSVVSLGAIVLLTGINIVQLNVFIELMDGLLMPLAVGFLFVLACSDILPEEVRVKGFYKYLLGTLFGICAAISLSTGVYSLVQDIWFSDSS